MSSSARKGQELQVDLADVGELFATVAVLEPFRLERIWSM